MTTKARIFKVWHKFAFSTTLALAWAILSTWIALGWTRELADMFGWGFAIAIVGGVAIVPGFMTAFLVASLLCDNRPARKYPTVYPPITVMIAAYNEKDSIVDTLTSVFRSFYPARLDVILVDDGSTDGTPDIAVAAFQHMPLTVLRQPKNAGKAAALNRALQEAKTDLVITLDADSYLYKSALRHLVERYLADPPDTKAVAGTVLVRNSRLNWVTKAQEWDYFHGISAIKRSQSLYQGTLVAQGAFSIYDRKVLLEVGGWADCVGEDIVLTWAILKAGYRVGHAEDACCFTNVPPTLSQFIRQRQRWARGMIEAFKQHPGITVQPRMTTLFIWWNLLFPWLDFAYTFFFIPGVILAAFGIYWIAGPMTIILVPMAMLMNLQMFHIGKRMFSKQGLQVRRNIGGFITYVLMYGVLLQPACFAGYVSELLGLRKTWGTK